MSSDPDPAPPPPATRPRKKRRALRIALYVLGTPLVLAGLLLVVLHTGPGKERVRAAVLARLSERVDGQVELGVVDYAIFGEVKLGDVHLRDPQGTEAVALSSLTVRPSWSDLLRGDIVIERVALSGLAVHVIKDADGGSNLQRLIKPRPEDPQKKPLDRWIKVQAIAMDGVAVDIAQPDGTKIVLSDIAVEGALSALPAERVVDVEIGKLALSAVIDKGEGGLKLGVRGETGITVKLDKGAGKATLHPLTGHVAVTLPENAERGFDIALDGFSADIGDGGVGLSLDKLLAGAVALASVEVKGRVADGKMDGSQQCDVLGLKVSGSRVNELLGRDVLLGDIDIETHVLGPPDKIAVASKITTPGAALTVDGAVGVADPADPSYDVAVTLTGVDTEKLLAPALGIAPVSVEKVEAKVKGKGRKADSAGAVATVKVTGATASGVRLDGLEFEGELKKGVLHVRSVEAKALGQRVTASGEIELATKRVDLTVGVEGDVGEVLGKLRAAGHPVKSNLPRGAVRLPPGDFTVTAKGFLGGALDVGVSAKKMGVLGGSVGIDARAALVRHDPPLEDGKKVTVTALDADIHLGGIKLSSILAMRGKKIDGMDGALDGDIHVEGSAEKPRAKLTLGFLTSRTDGGKTVRLSLTGDVSGSTADVKAQLLPGAGGEPILGVSAKLPLSLQGQRKGIDPHRPLEVSADLPKRTFADLWALVPESALPASVKALFEGGLNIKLIPGDVAMSLDVKGTAAKPDARLRATVQAQALVTMGFPQVQKVDLDATVRPAAEDAAAQGLAAQANVGVWLDAQKGKLVQIKADADLSRSPVLGKPELAYRAGVTVGPLTARDLYMAPPDVQATEGTLFASVDVKGDRRDLTGQVLVSGDGLKPKGKGPIGVGASLTLGEEATSVDVKVRVPDAPDGPTKSDGAVLSGKIGLAGKGLFEQLKDKEHLDPKLALVLDIPRRALATLGWLRPALEKAPGNLVGSIAITGTAKAPLAKGGVTLGDVQRVDGKIGGAGLTIDAGNDQILAKVGVGLTDPDAAPVKIVAHVPRASIAKMRDGAILPVDATIRAEKVDIREIVPASLLADTKVSPTGRLDWSMDVHAGLARKGEKVELTEGSIKGQLDLHDATLGLPGTKRAYRDVKLFVKADDAGIHLDALRAVESDQEVKERTLLVKGDVGLDKLRPTAASLTIAADRWLVFGPRDFGFADAPRGTLTLSAAAKADLTQPIRTASVNIGKLELLVPERFERAHQPEDVQAGDLVFLGEAGAKLGKLPVPDSVAEKAAQKNAAPAEAGAGPEKQEGWDIAVRIPQGAHILRAPIDLWPEGDLSVKIRPTSREIKASLAVKRGSLSISGAEHAIVKGTISFDAKNPKGFLDLHMERPMRAAALRQISEASGGTAVKIHMSGPFLGAQIDRKTILSGAGSAGALWDVLSMHNVGRARALSEPDLPWSVSTEFPQHDSLLVLGFMAVNLPHLLFIDRFAAWGDPYDDPRAYGKITHFEAERFTAGNALRFRVGARPPTAGQSEAEVEVDYVIVNVPRMMLGVGVTGGTRGGGGPGVVWEWSSKD